jgi:hypothetical protein
MLTGKNKHALHYSKHSLFKNITSTWKNPNLLLHTMISCFGKKKITNIKMGYSEEITLMECER